MDTSETARAQRFAAYVEQLALALGHRDRHEPLRAYVTGLCLPGDRKSIEPMAARVDPRHVRARHQSMHHFIADAPWDAAAVLRVAREWVLEPLARHGPVAAWIVAHAIGAIWDPALERVEIVFRSESGRPLPEGAVPAAIQPVIGRPS